MSTSRPIRHSRRSRSPIRSMPTAISVTTNFGFNPGGPGDIVVMRLYYKWPVYVNLARLQSLDGERRLQPARRDRRVPQRTLRFVVIEGRAMNASTFIHRSPPEARALLQRSQRHVGRRIRHAAAADDDALSRHCGNLAGHQHQPQGDADGARAGRPCQPADQHHQLGHDQHPQRRVRRSSRPIRPPI